MPLPTSSDAIALFTSVVKAPYRSTVAATAPATSSSMLLSARMYSALAASFVDAGLHRAAVVLGAAGERDRGTFGREHLHDSLADAPSAAGDQRDLAVEPHDRSLLSGSPPSESGDERETKPYSFTLQLSVVGRNVAGVREGAVMTEHASPGAARAFVDGVVDTYERIAAIHDGAPLTKRDGTVELTRFDDIVAVTKRRDVHSIDPDMAAIVSMALGAGRPLIPLMLDGEQHTKYRKLLDPLFAPKQVARLEPVIRNLSETLIDAFAADGASTSSRPSANRCPARSS